MNNKQRDGIIDFILLMCLSGSFAYVASLLVIKFIANGGM